jgi:hypothetical protein
MLTSPSTRESRPAISGNIFLQFCGQIIRAYIVDNHLINGCGNIGRRRVVSGIAFLCYLVAPVKREIKGNITEIKKKCPG